MCIFTLITLFGYKPINTLFQEFCSVCEYSLHPQKYLNENNRLEQVAGRDNIMALLFANISTACTFDSQDLEFQYNGLY